MSEAWGMVTKTEVISRAASRWKEGYEKSGYWNTPHLKGQTAKEIYEKLKYAKCASEINEIIGNDSWTRLNCDVCAKDCLAAISLDNDNGGSLNVCEKCIDLMKEKLYDHKTFYWPFGGWLQ